jgi:hypothetical protein
MAVIQIKKFDRFSQLVGVPENGFSEAVHVFGPALKKHL